MQRPSFLDFTPAPARTRRDGWTPDRQRRFIVQLARGLGVREAAASVGMGRQSAYTLRDRPGAESFARAWDQACNFARRSRRPDPLSSPKALIDGVERLLVPRFHRGRLVGFVERDETRGLMRQLLDLDRMVDGVKGDKGDTNRASRGQACRFPSGSTGATGGAC